MALTRFALVLSLGFCTLTTAHAALMPDQLRCEYRENPAGIDVKVPRLSWVLRTDKPEQRSQIQSAYQVIVASTLENLTANHGDLWDSGKVQSDETAHVVYGGKPLRSGQEAWWKVRVYDAAGNESPWSSPALWSAGLLEPSDWKAKWIGYDAPDAQASPADEPQPFVDLKGAKWVWLDEGNPIKDAPKADRFFRKTINLPADRKRKRAVFAITADNNFKLFVNGKEAGGGGDFHTPVMIDVAPHLTTGPNVLAIVATNGGGPAGLIGRLKIEYDGGGEPLVTAIDQTWTASQASADGWLSPKFDDSAWSAAKVIATAGDPPWGMPGVRQLVLPPPPILRTTFDATKPIKRATAYATALGIYELSLNGNRVGDDELRPGWTDYRKRVYYQTYDVTGQVQSGKNEIRALLGDGWYAGYFGFSGQRNIYGGEPRLLAQINIEYTDGSTDTIVTDDSWQAAYGPIREADLLMGCTYDASREKLESATWNPVIVSDAPKIAVQAQPADSVKRIEELPAREMTEPKPGVYVFDLKQNMVGWARFRFRGKEGGKVRFRYAEMLNPDGTLYTTSLRGARATDTYTAANDDVVSWEPKLTFHGFRYVEITGLASKPDLSAVTGIVVHSLMRRTGTYETSNPLVNQLVHNIVWGQKGNYLEVPTDCPQRDERLGWTGDAQAFIRTGVYNFDISAFMTKWLVDLITDGQHPDGSFPDVAPDVLGGHGNVAWSDAGIICPYVIYRMYGDTRVIEQHYAAMAKYIDYLEKSSKDLVRGQGAYGDWLNLGGGAKSEVIGTAYFAYVTRLLGEMSAAIGKDVDAKRYADLAKRVKAKFIAEFVQPDGGIKDSSQTGFALAFAMDLVPDEMKPKATERFVDEIKKKDWHLATGFVGTSKLLPALTRAGRSDVAYRLVMNEDFPSWLFQVKLGATTMWERWDGWHPQRGFQDPGMNSFNHYAFGAVGEWLYHTSAGIEIGSPGFKKIVIRPQPGGGLTHATARYDSIRGTIESSWERKGGTLTISCVIPPNTTATIYAPSSDPAKVSESEKPLKDSGLKFGPKDGATAIELGSGKYTFTLTE